MKKPLLPPPNRDTTANPADLIAERFCTALLWISLGIAVVAGFMALLGRNGGKLGVTVTFAIIFVLMLATRRWWKKTDTSPDGSPLAAPVPSAPSSFTTPAPASVTASPAVQRPRILILNASLGGHDGNSARVIELITPHFAPHADVIHARLAGPGADNLLGLKNALQSSHALVIATGTHWDSWSSPLQKLLEDATPAEGTALWLGKPVSVLVTEHSTGGKGVLSRLQGVLVTLGCAIPPMSGLVLSRAAVIAAQHDPKAANDFWCADDLAVVAHNLVEAARGTRNWRTWPVDRTDFADRWLA
ncbi:MAG: NAD(P)H-dependent oxidoreductase [Opitutaceae bacterium]|jgi:chromate reductase